MWRLLPTIALTLALATSLAAGCGGEGASPAAGGDTGVDADAGTDTGSDADAETDPLTPDERLRQALADHDVAPLSEPAPQDPARVALGRALFFDPILSGNRDTSCASCHDPTKMTSDAMALGAGTGAEVDSEGRRLPGHDRQFIPRNATEIFNRGDDAWRTMFWDSRVRVTDGGYLITPAGSRLPDGLDDVLTAQAMFPVVSRDEMRGERGDTDVFGEPNELAAIVDGLVNQIWDALMARLLAIDGYRDLFTRAYPDVPADELTFVHAAKALAAFEIEAWTFTDSPFQRYLAGDDAALDAEQKAGAALFFGDAGCGQCHSGALLTDQKPHNIGVPQIGPGKFPDEPLDLGYGRVSNNPQYNYAFRTPPLHNVELTAPYMHNGAYATLEDAVRHHVDAKRWLRDYDGQPLPDELRDRVHGGSLTLEAVLATIDPACAEPIELSDAEVDQIVAFLRSLTDPAARDTTGVVPETVPSGLPVE